MQRFLVIRGGAVGDLILTLPALRALRQAFPQATLELLGSPARAILAHHEHYAHSITDMEHLELYRLFSHTHRYSPTLASYLSSFTVIVSYLPTPAEPFVRNVQRYFQGEIRTCSPHPPAHRHITDHLVEPILPWLQAPYQPIPQVYVTPAAQATAERFWQASGLPAHGVIAWHPGSGGTQKLWPLAGWQQVMAWAAQQGYPGLLISGPAEHERGFWDSPGVSLPPWPRAEGLSLPEVAALLARCQLFLGHDSGISHLAAAVGTTTIALFGPTSPYVWGPRSQRAYVVQPQPPGPLTLENLPPSILIAVLARALAGTLAFVPSAMDCTIVPVPTTAVGLQPDLPSHPTGSVP